MTRNIKRNMKGNMKKNMTKNMTGKHEGRLTLVESHDGKTCRLFDQAIYTYLISCRVESSFRVELLNQASQLDLSARVQLLNLTQHFFKKISTQLDTFRVEYSTWRDQSRENQCCHEALSLNLHQLHAEWLN